MHHTKLLLVDYLGNTYFGVFFLNEWQELFDFIHKIVRPSFTIRLDMEQAVINIENDSEVIEYISQYVDCLILAAGNFLIALTIAQTGLQFIYTESK